MLEFPSTISLPIAWGDMDAYRHVNNTVHIRWFESSRIRYLEESGIHDLLKAHRLGPILASVQCSYKRQLHYPGTVTIGSSISRVGRSSLTMAHAVWNQVTEEVAAEGESVVVVFDFEKQRPRRIPDDVRDAVQAFESPDGGAARVAVVENPFQFASDYDGDLHLFPKNLEEPEYGDRWKVWVILADGSRQQVPPSSPSMCVNDGVVTNPLGTTGHQKVTGWDVDFMHAAEIEVTIDDGPPIRMRHPRP